METFSIELSTDRIKDIVVQYLIQHGYMAIGEAQAITMRFKNARNEYEYAYMMLEFSGYIEHEAPGYIEHEAPRSRIHTHDEEREGTAFAATQRVHTDSIPACTHDTERATYVTAS